VFQDADYPHESNELEADMTATDRVPESKTTTPNISLDELKSRYSNVREPIVVALHILLQEPSIPLEAAKETAKAYGVRITAASVAAAQRLRARMDATPAAPVAPASATPATRHARRARAAEPALDAEALIRGVVTKLASQGNVEAERLRASIRRAIDLLSGALA
jgi:hypothetical protein